MLSLSSFIDRRNGCTKFAYHAHGTADGDTFCCYPWLVYHDIKSAMHCSLRLASTMINHLTSRHQYECCWWSCDNVSQTWPSCLMESDGPCDSCNQTRLWPSLLAQVSDSELTDEYTCTSVSISLMHHHAPEMLCLATHGRESISTPCCSLVLRPRGRRETFLSTHMVWVWG